MYYVPAPGSLDPHLEAERPCCFWEYVGPLKCWDEIGMRIRWTIPEVPGTMVSHRHDPIQLRVCLECKKPVPIREISANAWTNAFHKNNLEGIYREIPLVYEEKSRSWDDQGVTCYEFSSRFTPTADNSFRLTFNVKFGKILLWVNKIKLDKILKIDKVRYNSDLLQKQYQTQITKKIYMGNYLAMLLADEMGYDAMLSLDHLTEELQEPLSSSHCPIKSILACNHCDSGAENPISEDKVRKIVKWMKQNNASREKILIGDRYGLGRVGSALTAYIFANNPNLTFEEAFEYVQRRKPNAFCHKGLRKTLEKLYPRTPPVTAPKINPC